MYVLFATCSMVYAVGFSSDHHHLALDKCGLDLSLSPRLNVTVQV